MPDQPQFGLQVTTPPASEPVSLDEMRNWLRVDFSDDDDKIAGLITAARVFVEKWTRRICMPTTFTMSFDRFALIPNTQYAPGNPSVAQPILNNTWPLDPSAWALLVPRSPLISVTSIQYVTSQQTTQTMDPSTYTVDAISEPGRLTPVSGSYWPAVTFGPNVVTVIFVAGYANAAAVPFGLKTAIKMIVSALYDDPSGALLSSSAGLPMWLESLLDAQTVRWMW